MAFVSFTVLQLPPTSPVCLREHPVHWCLPHHREGAAREGGSEACPLHFLFSDTILAAGDVFCSTQPLHLETYCVSDVLGVQTTKMTQTRPPSSGRERQTCKQTLW